MRLTERARLLGLEPAAIRMALGRLVQDRMARQIERGTYALGPAAEAIHTKARGWTSVERTIRAWQGQWIVVLVDHLGRTDRSRMQQRERALRLSGFARSSTGAWVRPDNLVCEMSDTVSDIQGLGLDREAAVFGACQAEASIDAGFRDLWSHDAIESGYRFWLAELTASTARVATLRLGDAARETLLLGQSVIRAINSDPLLPDEMIDTTLRAALVAAMVRYDAVGQRFWARIDAGEKTATAFATAKVAA